VVLPNPQRSIHCGKIITRRNLSSPPSGRPQIHPRAIPALCPSPTPGRVSGDAGHALLTSVNPGVASATVIIESLT